MVYQERARAGALRPILPPCSHGLKEDRVDATGGIASIFPSLSAIGMLLTFLRDALDARGGLVLDFIAGLGLGGRWPRLAGREGGGSLMVAIGTISLIVATSLALAGVIEARSRWQRGGSSSAPTPASA